MLWKVAAWCVISAFSQFVIKYFNLQ